MLSDENIHARRDNYINFYCIDRTLKKCNKHELRLSKGKIFVMGYDNQRCELNTSKLFSKKLLFLFIRYIKGVKKC